MPSPQPVDAAGNPPVELLTELPLGHPSLATAPPSDGDAPAAAAPDPPFAVFATPAAAVPPPPLTTAPPSDWFAPPATPDPPVTVFARPAAAAPPPLRDPAVAALPAPAVLSVLRLTLLLQLTLGPKTAESITRFKAAVRPVAFCTRSAPLSRKILYSGNPCSSQTAAAHLTGARAASLRGACRCQLEVRPRQDDSLTVNLSHVPS